MFNADWELRWKQRLRSFTFSNADSEPGFIAVGQNWETQLRQPLVPFTETRFPKGFTYESVNVPTLF